MNLTSRIQQKEDQLRLLVNQVSNLDIQLNEFNQKKNDLVREIIALNGAIQEIKSIQQEEKESEKVPGREKQPTKAMVPPIEEGQ